MATTIDLVPGDDWSVQLTIKDENGAVQDLTGWTVVTATVTWEGGSVSLTTDLTQAASGIVTVSAADSATAGLPLGLLSVLTLKMQSSTGIDTTFVARQVNGVTSNSDSSADALMPGTQGPAGL